MKLAVNKSDNSAIQTIMFYMYIASVAVVEWYCTIMCIVLMRLCYICRCTCMYTLGLVGFSNGILGTASCYLTYVAMLMCLGMDD